MAPLEKKVWLQRAQLASLVALLALLVAWLVPFITIGMLVVAGVAIVVAIYAYFRYRSILLREVDEKLR